MEGFTMLPVTLDSLAEGMLNQQFLERLAELAAVFGSRLEYSTDKDGNVKAQIVMTSTFTCARDGQVSVSVSADLKRPKRMAQSRAVFQRGGQWFTMPQEQQKLGLVERPSATVTPIQR